MRRLRAQRVFVIFIAVVYILLASTTSLIAAAPSSANNAYAVLGVSRSASQKDIQKAYRRQCLKLHPDKNTHLSPNERQRCEVRFKLVQEAYSAIGDEQERRSYDLRERYGDFGGKSSSSFRPSGRSSSFSTPFGGRGRAGDPNLEDFFRAFAGQSGPSVFFTRGPDGQPRFGVRRSFPTGPADFVPNASGSSFKSIYKQKVNVPLEKLFTGAEVEFQLVDNVWTRWRAAIRGKIIYLSLYQGLLYSLPIMRTSKALAGIIGLFVAHVTLPKPDPMQSYLSTLPKGSKQVRVRFQQKRNDQPEIVFEVHEAPHKRYQRHGDSLKTFVKITRSQAEKGCVKRIPPLDPKREPITITIPPNITYGEELCVPGEGWPTGEADVTGDLIVRVEIQKGRGGRRETRKKQS